MTPERAREVIEAGRQYCNWEKFYTAEEKEFLNQVWDTMPGYTCRFDALLRVAKGEIPQEKI